MAVPRRQDNVAAPGAGEPEDGRPIGFVRPGAQFSPQIARHLQLGIKALHEARWGDADMHIQALQSDEVATAWRCFLEGELHLHRGRLRHADPLFVHAASLALAMRGSNAESTAPATASCQEAMRLAAAALERVGVVRRRFELVDQATRAHRLAFELRREHGSVEEQWQSALSLGLVGRLAGRWDEAVAWCVQALRRAESAAESPVVKLALASEEMARSLASHGKHQQAVAAWRKALDFRRRHDPATIDAPRAQLQLGAAMVRQAEELMEEPDDTACAALLSEAGGVLQEAHDALAAFGQPAQPDTEQAARLLDFAQRLLISVE